MINRLQALLGGFDDNYTAWDGAGRKPETKNPGTTRVGGRDLGNGLFLVGALYLGSQAISVDINKTLGRNYGGAGAGAGLLLNFKSLKALGFKIKALKS